MSDKEKLPAALLVMLVTGLTGKSLEELMDEAEQEEAARVKSEEGSNGETLR